MSDTYRDLWICSALPPGEGWAVRCHRVRWDYDCWRDERGFYVTCTDTGIGHGATREEAVRSYLAYLDGLCREAADLLRRREETRAKVEALLLCELSEDQP